MTLNAWTSRELALVSSHTDDDFRAFSEKTIDHIAAVLRGSIPAPQAAENIAQLVEKQTHVSVACTKLWLLVISAASEVDADPSSGFGTITEILAELVATLSQRPPAINRLDAPMLVFDYEGEVDYEFKPISPGQPVRWSESQLWQDLPGLSQELTERWNGPHGIAEMTRSHDRSSAAQWTSLNDFVAKLTSRYSHNAAVRGGFANFGVVTIQIALDGKESVSSTLAAAVVWLKTVPDDLRMSLDDLDGNEAAEIRRSWRRRLVQVEQDAASSQEVRDLAGEGRQLLDAWPASAHTS